MKRMNLSKRADAVYKDKFRPSLDVELRLVGVAICGNLEKKSRVLGSGWLPRFYVANSHYLRCYKDSTPGRMLLNAVDLRGVDIADPEGRIFKIILADGYIKLRAPEEQAAIDWVFKLRELQLDDAINTRRSTATAVADTITNNTKRRRFTRTTLPRLGEDEEALSSSISNNNPDSNNLRRNSLITKCSVPSESSETSSSVWSTSTASTQFTLATRRASVRKRDALTPELRESLRPSLEVACAGFMLKKSSKRLRQWKQRFFVAAGDHLRYFLDDCAGRKCLGCVELRGVVLHCGGQNDELIALAMADSTMWLKPPTEEDRNRWIDALTTIQDVLHARNAIAQARQYPPYRETLAFDHDMPDEMFERARTSSCCGCVLIKVPRRPRSDKKKKGLVPPSSSAGSSTTHSSSSYTSTSTIIASPLRSRV